MENELKRIDIKRDDENYDKDFLFTSYTYAPYISKRKYKKKHLKKEIIYEYSNENDIDFADAKIEISGYEFYIYRKGVLPKLLFKEVGYIPLLKSDSECIALYKQRKIISFLILLFKTLMCLGLLLFIILLILMIDIGGFA